MIRNRYLLPAIAMALCCGCQPLWMESHRQPGVDAPGDKPATAESVPGAVALLRQRQYLCRAPEQHRVHIIRSPATTREGKLTRLLAATCEPERYPGILRQALAAVRAEPDWGDSQQALIELVADHARAYQALEVKNADLEARLKATIDGIREIESDMNNVKQ